jgi:hypothetical protein
MNEMQSPLNCEDRGHFSELNFFRISRFLRYRSLHFIVLRLCAIQNFLCSFFARPASSKPLLLFTSLLHLPLYFNDLSSTYFFLLFRYACFGFVSVTQQIFHRFPFFPLLSSSIYSGVTFFADLIWFLAKNWLSQKRVT